MIIISDKPLSTLEREMQDPAFKKKFEEEYKDFQLSETLHELIKTSKKTSDNKNNNQYPTEQLRRRCGGLTYKQKL